MGSITVQSVLRILKKRFNGITMCLDLPWFNRSEIPGAGIKVAHLQGVGFLLEVFEAPGANALPEDRRVPNRDLMTHGNKHMSFGVPDGKKAKAELEAMGVEIAMVAEVDDTYGVFIRDNTGNLIEIFEESGDVVFNQHKDQA